MKIHHARFKPAMLAVLVSMAAASMHGATAGTITGWNNQLGPNVIRDGTDYNRNSTNIYGDNNYTLTSGIMIGDHQTSNAQLNIISSVLIGNNITTFDGSAGNEDLKNYPMQWGQIAIGDRSSVAGNGIAIGLLAESQGDGAVALGDWASASEEGVALGGVALADEQAVSVGVQAHASADSVALGYRTSASGADSVALGYRAQTWGDNAVAIGSNASAGGRNSVAIGSNASAGGRNSVAIGSDSVAWGENEFSVGNGGLQRRVTNVADGIDGNDAVNMNQLNALSEQIAQTISGASTGVQGSYLQATVRAAAPVVSGSLFAAASADGEVATATGARSTAMGASAQATADNSVALGADSVADRANTVSVGAEGKERQITNVAAGTQGTDAVNVNQLNGAVSQANSYTDQAIAGAKNDMKHYSDRAAASVLAIPSIPVLNPGEKWVGAAVGNYGSSTAVGLAAAYQVTSNLNLGLGASTANGGSTAMKAQAGYRW